MHGIDKGGDHNSCEDRGAESWDSKNTCFSASPQPSGTKVAASASHDLQVWGSSFFSFSKRIQVCYFLRQPNYDPYDDPWADDELNNNALGTQMGYTTWLHVFGDTICKRGLRDVNGSEVVGICWNDL